jgi:outer membrane protein OmpA-like peptidoglycan-associated protein
MAYAGQIQSGNMWQDIVTTSAAIDAITGEATWDASTMFIPNPVVGDAEDVEGSPVISLSSDGQAGVAISSRDVYGVVSKRTIQISFYSCTGAPEVCTWSDTADLTSTSDYALSPNVVMSNDGQSVFAYWKNNSGSIVSKSANYAASVWTWDASTATLPTVGDEQYLDFAYNTDRTKFVLAWSSSNEIYSTTSLNSGSTWSSAQSHGFAAAGATTEPSVDISDGVSPVIVVMYGISGKAKAMAGRVTGSTIEWGAATEFGTTSGFRSSVAVKGDGSAALSAWGQSPSYTSTLTFEPPSSDSALTALSFSSGTLTPTFASGTTSYTSTVAYSVNSVTISATKSNAGATIEYRLGTAGAFTALNSGTSSVSLAVGANTVEVKVTAEDGSSTIYSFTLTVDSEQSNDPVVEVEVDENGNVTIVVTDPNDETTTSTVTGASKPVDVSIVNGQLVVEDETFSGNVEVTIQVENESGFSTTVTVLLVVNPELPSGLKIKLKTLKKKPNQVTGSDVQLSWRSVSNATSYQILVGSNVVGSTTSTSYQLRNILFNKSVSVIALGNDETSSQAVTIDAKPSRAKIANVNFDFNAWELSKSAKSALKNVVKLVRKSDIDTVVIQGNTDIIGSKWSARWLSKIRAETVKKFLQMRLKGLGIKFKIVASGSSNPVKSNSSATGRALNRRVEILFP